jgi:hypothetical protein
MSRTLSQIFRWNCPKCGAENTCTCKKCHNLYRFDLTRRPDERLVNRHLTFGENQWRHITARAKILGITISGLMRLGMVEILILPPQRLIS